MPSEFDPTRIGKVVVFDPADALPLVCREHKFHVSETGGLMHVFSSGDWLGILRTLITPREIWEYLQVRAGICSRHPAETRTVSERALVGQFLVGEEHCAPADVYEHVLDRFHHDVTSFDMSGILRSFGARMTPLHGTIPDHLASHSTDYYPILAELAKLPRNELKAFKERFLLCWKRCGERDPFITRFVSSAGTGFLLAAVPTGWEPQAVNGLHNFVVAHKYDQRLERCIGVCFIRDGEYRNTPWVMINARWERDPDFEAQLVDCPLPAVSERYIRRYSFKE